MYLKVGFFLTFNDLKYCEFSRYSSNFFFIRSSSNTSLVPKTIVSKSGLVIDIVVMGILPSVGSGNEPSLLISTSISNVYSLGNVVPLMRSKSVLLSSRI